MDYMEKEYGIKEGQEYLLTFEDLGRNEHRITGEILNFDCNQFVIKANKGLYIIKRTNVIEMMPIKDDILKTSKELNYYDKSFTYRQGDTFILDRLECKVINTNIIH